MLANRFFLSCIVGTALLLAAAASPAFAQGTPDEIESGSQVAIEYTLKLEDGTVVDTNVGGEPLVYEQGGGQLLPALEDSLVGLGAEETKSVTLSPEEGYGKVNPEAYQTVALERLPEDAREVGTPLVLQTPDGQQAQARVHEVEGEEAVLDFNHPLAGETLNFDIKVLSVR